jgi:hypothetical protein
MSRPDPIEAPHAGQAFVSPQPAPTAGAAEGFCASAAFEHPYVAQPRSSSQHEAWNVCWQLSHAVVASDGWTSVWQMVQRAVTG